MTKSQKLKAAQDKFIEEFEAMMKELAAKMNESEMLGLAVNFRVEKIESIFVPNFTISIPAKVVKVFPGSQESLQ
mgnify:CR=1 FL=1